MTDYELAALLAVTVAEAPMGEKGSAHLLFGIKYADHLVGRLQRVSMLARFHFPEADVWPTAQADISYGVRMARFVALKEPPPWLK